VISPRKPHHKKPKELSWRNKVVSHHISLKGEKTNVGSVVGLIGSKEGLITLTTFFLT
jgi:hypothetical protein